jgi:hypothetical protein
MAARPPQTAAPRPSSVEAMPAVIQSGRRMNVILGQLGRPLDVRSRPSGARRRRSWEAGLPVRREWIINVPAPVEEPPLTLPEPEREAEPEPVPEEAPA